MLRLLFVLGIMAVGIAGAIRSRFAALLLYVWFALFRPQDWMWFDITSYRPSLWLGALLVVPSIATGVLPVIGHILSLGALLFLGSALLAQSSAVDQAAGWYWLDFLTKLILVSLFSVRLLSTRWRIAVFVAVMAFSFGFHPIKGGAWSVLAPGAMRYFEGPGGAFIDNNAYALGTVMILPFLLVTAQSAPWRWLRLTAAVSLPLAALTVVGTFSRGGLVALGVAIVTFILLQRRRALALACAAVILPAAIWMTPVPAGYTDRMSTLGAPGEVEDSSAQGRLHFWRVALRMSADKPRGVGLWNFQSNYDAYDFLHGRYGVRRAVHNSHLQVLTETGLLGAGAWILLFASAFFLTLRARRRAAFLGSNERFATTMSTALITSMTAFLVGGSFVSMALNDLTWLTFAVVASLDRFVRQGEPGEESSAVVDIGSGAVELSTWQPPAHRLS